MMTWEIIVHVKASSIGSVGQLKCRGLEDSGHCARPGRNLSRSGWCAPWLELAVAQALAGLLVERYLPCRDKAMRNSNS